MPKRKKKKKKKLHELPSLSQEEQTLLEDLLRDPGKIDLANIRDQIPSPRLAQALVERLPADVSDIIPLISALREAFDNKNVHKAIRKTVFRLHQKGISVSDSDLGERVPFSIPKAEKPEPTTYLGAIDAFGNRAIFIVLPQIPTGVDVGLGVVGDEQGIIQFLFGRYSKKRMRDVRDIFFEQFPDMIETSLPHVATILEKAYKEQEQAAGESSRDYVQLRSWLIENVSLLDRPVIYDFIPPERASERILTGSQIDKLLGHPLMELWIIDPEEIKPLVGKITEAEESRILISEVQKSERISEIEREAVTQLFPDPKRSIMKQRLEEMAYFFFKQDEEDYALLSLSAARSMEDKDSLLAVNPFLMALVVRSLEFYKEASEEGFTDLQEDSSPGIVIPQ